MDSAEDELLEEVGAAFEESTLRESALLTSKIQRGIGFVLSVWL
jgi:hypothetical protein